jgi:hypothetical protein
LVAAAVDPDCNGYGSILLRRQASRTDDVDAQTIFANLVALELRIGTSGSIDRCQACSVPGSVQRLRRTEPVLVTSGLGVRDPKEDILTECREVDAFVRAVEYRDCRAGSPCDCGKQCAQLPSFCKSYPGDGLTGAEKPLQW